MGVIFYLVFYKFGDRISEPGEVREPWKERGEVDEANKACLYSSEASTGNRMLR